MSIDRTPKTWGAEELTSSDLNAEVKALWTGLQAAWTSYTPTWTATSVNPAIGNGTLVGAYMRVGKTIHFRITLTAGSTTTFGTGRWILTLPVATVTGHLWRFVGHQYDVSAASTLAAWGLNAGGVDTLDIYTGGTTAGGYDRSLQGSVPFAWGDGDRFSVSGTYEAA